MEISGRATLAVDLDVFEAADQAVGCCIDHHECAAVQKDFWRGKTPVLRVSRLLTETSFTKTDA